MLFAMAYYIYAGSDQPQRAGQEEEQGSDLVEVRPAVNNRWDKVAYAVRTAPLTYTPLSGTKRDRRTGVHDGRHR
jgi:hypothetical protein